MGRKPKKQVIENQANSLLGNETDLTGNEKTPEDVLSKYDALKTEAEFSKEKKDSKYYKRKKEDKEAEENFAKSANITAHIALNIIVSRLPKKQSLTDEESKAFDEAFTNLARKYYSSIQKFSEETNFVLILALIIIPRIEFNKKKKSDLENKNEN